MKCGMAGRCDWQAHYWNARGTAKEWQCQTCGEITARRPMTAEQRAKNAERQRRFQEKRKAQAQAASGATRDADNAEARIGQLEKQIVELRKSRDSWRALARAEQARARKTKASAGGDGLADVVKRFGKRAVIAFIHPDKHGGNEIATAIAQLVNGRC